MKALTDRLRELEGQLAVRTARCEQLESQLKAAGRIRDKLRAQREELKARIPTRPIPSATAPPR